MENRDNILNELKGIAPELSKLEKKQFDDVPLNYFSSFPETMMKKVWENELVDSPSLLQIEKLNRAEVPAEYFSTFPQLMLKKVSSTQNEITPGPQWIKLLNDILDRAANTFLKPKYAYAFAGTLSLVIIGLTMLIEVDRCTDLECKMASLTDTEIDSYLEGNPDDSRAEVFEAVSNERVNNVEVYKDALKDMTDEELDHAILD